MFKHFRSLMLACTALVSSAAFAGDWTVPAPQGTTFVAEDSLYMWNVGAKGFLHNGEAWGTQAVISQKQGVVFQWKATETVGVYQAFNRYNSGSNYMFRTHDSKAGKDCGAMFVDNNGGGGRNLYEITDNGGKYLVHMSSLDSDAEEYDATKYLGVWTDRPESQFFVDQGITWGVWYDVVYDASNGNCDWIFVSTTEYKVYAAKAKLIDTMTEAEEAGVSTAEAEAVLNNAQASVEDINAAIKKLTEDIAGRVTPDNPKDMTSLIPENTCDSHNSWITTAVAKDDGEKIQNNAIATNRCDDPVANAEGAFEGKFWENWDPSAWSGKMYQTVTGIPNGVYKVSLAAFVNTLDENNSITKSQYVFFNDAQCLINTGINRSYSATIAITNGELSLGLCQAEPIANWCGIDNAKLLFYGNCLESYKYPAQELDNNLEIEIEKILDGRELDGYYTESYYIGFRNAVDKSQASTSIDEAAALLPEVQAAYNALLDNVRAWCKMKDLRDEVESACFDKGLALDWLLDEIDSYLGARTLSTEAILERIEWAKEEIKKAEASSYGEGEDVTDIFIKNAAFNIDGTASAKEWTVESGNFGGGTSGVIEAWNNSFNLYQDLKGMQNGAYEIELQGFFRQGDSGDAYAKYAAGEGKVETFAYAGANEAPFVNIMDWGLAEAGDGAWTGPHDDNLMRPNDVTSANWAFNHVDRPYVVKVLGIVTDGTLRVGLKNVSETNYHQWSLWNGMRMTYCGTNAQYIRPALETLLVSASKTVETAMYSGDKQALTSAISAAEAAVGGSDGQAMIDAYQALVAASKGAEASINAYAKLATACEALTDALAEYEQTAQQEYVTQAYALLAGMADALLNGVWTADEAKAKTEEAYILVENLKIPGGEASDDNPQNYTFKVTNPDFLNDSKEGWTIDGPTDWHVGVQSNIIEGFSCTFQIYQDIEGLPEGTYEVQCNGFFRDESSEAANNAYLNDTTEIRGRLFVEYFTNDAERREMDLANIIQINDACMTATGDAGNWKNIEVNGNTYWYPNQRVAARDRFDMDGFDAYKNSIICKVAADGHLRIGFCNHAHKADDWAAVSNFKLIYYGKDSKKEPTGEIVSGIESHVAAAPAVKKAIFTIDGRMTNSLQKGINIVRTTDANGNIVVKKIMVK